MSANQLNKQETTPVAVSLAAGLLIIIIPCLLIYVIMQFIAKPATSSVNKSHQEQLQQQKEVAGFSITNLGGIRAEEPETKQDDTPENRLKRSILATVTDEEMEGMTFAEIVAEAKKRQAKYKTPSTWQTNPELYSISTPEWSHRLYPGDKITEEGITVTMGDGFAQVQSKEHEFLNKVFTGDMGGVSIHPYSIAYFGDWTLFEKTGVSETISDKNRDKWPRPNPWRRQ